MRTTGSDEFNAAVGPQRKVNENTAQRPRVVSEPPHGISSDRKQPVSSAGARPASGQRSAPSASASSGTGGHAQGRGSAVPARSRKKKRSVFSLLFASKKNSSANKKTGTRSAPGTAAKKKEAAGQKRKSGNVQTQRPQSRSSSASGKDLRRGGKSAGTAPVVKSSGWRTLRNRFLLFIAFTVLIGGITALVFSLSLRVESHPPTGSISFLFTDEEETSEERTSLRAARMIRAGTVYADFSSIADRCGYAMTGDRGEVRFIDASGGENVVFKIGTKVVQINGIKCVLDDVSVYEDGAVLVPLSFLQRYAEGITLQYDASKREMVCTRLISGYSTETVSERSHAEFASLTFRVAPGTRAGHIDENTLSEVLLYLTDPKRLAQKAAAAAMAAGTVIY